MFHDVSDLTLNCVVFVVEAIIFTTLLSIIPYFGSKFPLILIFVTLTLNNEIVSFNIVIVSIENNFDYVQREDLPLDLLDLPKS
jgi:hypothetical protein